MRVQLSSFSLCFALLALSGCLDPVSNMVVGTATVSTFSVEGKGPVDLALSAAKDQDCDIRNPKKYDGHYCIDESAKTLPDTAPPVYCHPTLGAPECTAVQDPHNNNNSPYVGQVAGSSSKKVVISSTSAADQKVKSAAENEASDAGAPIPLTPERTPAQSVPKKKGSAVQGS